MNAPDTTLAHRDDLAALVGEIERIETIIGQWAETPRGVVEAYRQAIETLQGEAIRRLVRVLKIHPVARQAMKEALQDDVVYAVLRHHNIIRASLSERVEAALEGIRPMLASHGGNVELVRVAPPTIVVRFLGACDGCPASALTFYAGVKKAIEDACPEITDIVQAKGLGGGGEESLRFISPFALDAKSAWHLACRLDDIPQGGIKALEVAGSSVLMSRQGASVTCFQNACAHFGMALDGGLVEKGIITCPYHQFQYDLASGECLTAPEVALQAHAVRVIGNRVEVRLSQ